MSSDAIAPPGYDVNRLAEDRRRAALRLAFGVTGCFAVVATLNLEVTFLAPFLAATLLVKLQRPPSLGQGIAFVVLLGLTTSVVLTLTGLLISNPAVLIVALTLLLYLTFYAHRRGAPEVMTLFLQISAVSIPAIAVFSPEVAGKFADLLVSAGAFAVVTVWVAHAACPTSVASDCGDAPAANPTRSFDPAVAARHALLDTLVLVPVLTWYILDASQVAVVVLIVIVSLLRLHDPEHDPEQGQRAATGLVLANLIAGISAIIVYNLVLLADTLLFFIVACLAASLMFAGRIGMAGDRAPLYALAFATFILLFGIGMAPLPGGSNEASLSRLLNVLLASVYTIGFLSLVTHWRHARGRRSKS